MPDVDRLDRLERQIQRVQDWQEVSNLQGRYNHLVLGHHWEAILALFAQKTPGVKAEIAESGVFHGLEGVRRVFVDMLGKLYDYPGMCAVHELTTPVIEVARSTGAWNSAATARHATERAMVAATANLPRFGS